MLTASSSGERDDMDFLIGVQTSANADQNFEETKLPDETVAEMGFDFPALWLATFAEPISLKKRLVRLR
jgi:hypothetical protein